MRTWLTMIVVTTAIVTLIVVAAGLTTAIWLAPPGGNTPFDVAFYKLGGGPEQQKLFLDRDYAEAKDLAKTFLTLLSAILVVSITFSEKVVDTANASLLALGAMIVCWIMLLIAIVACGVGLVFIARAANIVLYMPRSDHLPAENWSVGCFVTAGITFVFALLAMSLAGITSLLNKRRARKNTTEEFS